MNIHIAIRAQLYSGLLRTWTGPGVIEITEPFEPDGTVPGLVNVDYRPGAELLTGLDGNLRFGLDGRDLKGSPVVNRPVDIFALTVVDDGKSRILPFVRRGLLDTPTLENGVFSVGVSPRVNRAPPLTWSHEEQKRAHPGDSIFSQVRALAKGIRGIYFPRVPYFEIDGNYDNRAIQGADEGSGAGAPAPAQAEGRTVAPGVLVVSGGTLTKLTLSPWAGRRGT